MKQSAQSVTALPEAPDAERRGRMIRYSIAMAIRVPCLVLIVAFHQHWWIWLPLALAAVFLPYFAVVVANVGSANRNSQPERPGTVVPLRPQRGFASQTHDFEAGYVPRDSEFDADVGAHDPDSDVSEQHGSDTAENRSGRAS